MRCHTNWWLNYRLVQRGCGEETCLFESNELFEQQRQGLAGDFSRQTRDEKNLVGGLGVHDGHCSRRHSDAHRHSHSGHSPSWHLLRPTHTHLLLLHFPACTKIIMLRGTQGIIRLLGGMKYSATGRNEIFDESNV